MKTPTLALFTLVLSTLATGPSWAGDMYDQMAEATQQQAEAQTQVIKPSGNDGKVIRGDGYIKIVSPKVFGYPISADHYYDREPDHSELQKICAKYGMNFVDYTVVDNNYTTETFFRPLYLTDLKSPFRTRRNPLIAILLREGEAPRTVNCSYVVDEILCSQAPTNRGNQ